MLGEPRLVDVEAHLAVVDRRHAVLRVEDEPRVDVCRAPVTRTRSKTSPSSARERSVLSTPKSTSPCGLPAVSSAVVDGLAGVAAPGGSAASGPLSCSNACFTSFEIANESCVTSTTSVGVSPPPPQPAATSSSRASEERDDGLVTDCHLDSSIRHAALLAVARADREQDAVARRVMRASSAAKTFETPRLEPGSSVSPRERVREPLGASRPRPAPCSASSETSSPGSPASRALAAHDMRRAQSPMNASISRRRVAARAEEQQSREEVVEPAAVAARERGSACGPSASAASSASSRSVASFSAGWRSIRVPAASAPRDAPRATPSRSRRPRPSTSSPSASACSSPLSAAITRAPSGTGERGVGIGRIPACHHHDDLVRHAFLRWHYPDQVLRVGGALSRPLSPVARAPRYARPILAALALAMSRARRSRGESRRRVRVRAGAT